MVWKFTRHIGAMRRGSREVAVELVDGPDWDAASWPSIGSGPGLEMSVFQAREFLETWMRTIGLDRGVRPVLVVVVDGGGSPVLYLPLAIETKFGVTLLRFMDAGVSDLNVPIMARHRSLGPVEFAAVWKEILSRLPALDVIDLRKMPDHLNGVRNPLTYLACDPGHDNGCLMALCALPEVHGRASVVRTRKKLRRQYRRLSELGDTRFLCNPPGDALHRTANGLFDLKRMQYLRTWGRDFLAKPGIDRFYREMSQPGRLGRISQLSGLMGLRGVVWVNLGC